MKKESRWSMISGFFVGCIMRGRRIARNVTENGLFTQYYKFVKMIFSKVCSIIY